MESAYKLGWCYVQTERYAPASSKRFSYFVQAFPDSPQAPSALAQRALAYQEDKNYTAALSDLNMILTKYPDAKEREAALQQKALILGQQENPKGMADAFRQLLKEFPKSTVAAQAQYYIGKAAFDAKEYKSALAPLNAARQLDKEQYYNLATVRIISCHFYLKNRAALTKEVDALHGRELDHERPGGNPGMARDRILQREKLCRRPRNIWARLVRSRIAAA